jgi:ketosteroid isomerase-like protein
VDKAEAIATAQLFLQRLLTDFPACTAMLADDFAWENFLPAHVPFGGRYEGRAGLERYLAELAANWVIGELEFTHFIFDPGSQTLAASGVEKNGTAVPTGRCCDMAFMWEFRFASSGQLSYVREYNDTAAIGATFDA